jgi:hypothetical protein
MHGSDGLGAFYSLSPEWNADKTRVDKVRYWTAVARLFHGIDLAGVWAEEVGSMEEAGSGMRIPVTTY